MRLTRLLLGRYGHLSDLSLDFPMESGLHVILGANEAGKSTALAAIGDALFGFPHRSSYAFLHPTRDLRIGVSLAARDGRQGSFIRRKQRKDDLTDFEERPLPETAIAAFLAGASRERFERLFGLNSAELRRGGDAILKGEGEVGEAIMQAHTGLHGFRTAVETLEADCGRLFGDRRGRRDFHEAVARFSDARRQMGERKIEPADYKQAKDELDRLEAERAANAQRSGEAQARLSQLQRIRRTTPARQALQRLLAERAALGAVPPLPDDAAERYRDALGRREQAARERAREDHRAGEVQRELAELGEDATILAEAEAIDTLSAHRQRIAGAEGDRQAQRVIVAQHEAAIAAAARRLGLALDPVQGGVAGHVMQVPNALVRENVAQALRRHDRLTGQRTVSLAESHAARFRLDEAEAALQAMAEPLPVDEIRSARDAVRAEGRLDAELADAEAACAAATAACAQALAALPLWDRSLDALAAAPLPLDATIARHTTGLAATQETLRRIDEKIVGIDTILAQSQADAAAETAAGELPTDEVVAAARSRRDAAWQAIRSHFVDGGPPPHDVADLPDRFAALLRAADSLTDRRAAEQQRVVAAEQRRTNELRQRALRDAAMSERAAAAAAHEAEQRAWQAIWRPTGIAALDPAAMREWLQQRSAALALHDASRKAEARRDAVRHRHAGCRAMLDALLPADHAGGSLAALLRAADRICQEREQQQTQRAALVQAVETAAKEVRKTEAALAKIAAEAEAWQRQWGELAGSLGLPPDAPAEQALPALETWNEIDAAGRARQAALDRVEQMTVTIEQFRSHAAAVIARSAPDLSATAAAVAVPLLAARVAEARRVAETRTRLTADLARLRAAIDRFAAEQEAAEGELVTLRSLAGAADDDALRQAIETAAAYRHLLQQIAERETELQRLDDGKSLAALTEEAEGTDIDHLLGQITALEDMLRAIAAEDLENQTGITRLRHELARMEAGQDAAGSAQAMQTALADINDVAARYVPLRMANLLLRAGLDRFRRQQQDPLLNRAGQIFARLTEGRYDRLGVDEEDGKLLIKACRPDGSECQADRLSEGTLDQLYLALRLAAIESYSRSSEPLPFIADDLLVNFDDGRAAAAIRVLGEFGREVQVILFTHHSHIADLAEAAAARVVRLDSRQTVLAV